MTAQWESVESGNIRDAKGQWAEPDPGMCAASIWLRRFGEHECDLEDPKHSQRHASEWQYLGPDVFLIQWDDCGDYEVKRKVRTK